MPAWAGKWKGGRFYLTEGKPVFFIERRGRSVRLKTHDHDLAVGELARFLEDPEAFCRPPPKPEDTGAVFVTKERLMLYMDSIHERCEDYRKAKRRDLFDWAAYRDEEGQAIDLRTADKRALRVALGSFAGDGKDKRRTGGFKRRAESLNCFANFLVREGDLKVWSPLGITPKQKPAQTRAEREAYEPEQVRAVYRQIADQSIRDVIHLRTVVGMHDTEIQQIVGARLFKGPMPDRGVGIRTELDKPHEIKGVLQIRQKTKPRHRISVDTPALAAALRLRAGVPSRYDTYNALVPLGIVPSNLRHTFATLRGKGKIVHYDEGGVSLDEVAEIMGHRIGSKMTGSRYDKLQVPPMMKVPLEWD